MKASYNKDSIVLENCTRGGEGVIFVHTALYNNNVSQNLLCADDANNCLLIHNFNFRLMKAT